MTLATRLRTNRAVYAGAGAVDLAVEKLREVPDRVTKLQDTARTNASRLQENVREFQERVDTKDLPGAAVAYMTHLGTRVAEVIDELAERGKTVVHRFEVEAEIEVQAPELGEAKARRVKATTAKKPARPAAKKPTD